MHLKGEEVVESESEDEEEEDDEATKTKKVVEKAM